MGTIKNISLLFCFLGMAIFAGAQNTVVKTVNYPKKFKPPVLKTSLGKYSDSLNKVSDTEFIKLLSLPLVITDVQKGKYEVSTYKCLYKRQVRSENEETGKTYPTTSQVVQLFRSTPLSEIWQKSIGEQVVPGEEIYFFDIVVKDATGRFLFAPNFKLLIKDASN